MAKQKQNPQSIIYYAGITIQKLSLLVASGASVILWATLIAIAHGYSFTGSIKDVQFINANDMNAGNLSEIKLLTSIAVVFALVALVLSVLLLQIPQIQKYRKKLVLDGVLISTFLLMTAIWCQPIYTYILSKI